MQRSRLLACVFLFSLCLSGLGVNANPPPEECAVEPRWYCPREYELSANNICFKREKVPIKVVCQQGYVACHAGCCLVTTTDPEYVCPDGYTHEIERGCVKEEMRPPLGVCPQGFKVCTPEQNPKGGCCKATKTTRILECPSDKELDGDVCVSVDDRMPDVSCPDGFHISKTSGKCARTVTTKPEPSCPGGYTIDREGKACMRYDTQPAQGVCPTGYEPYTPESLAKKHKKSDTHTVVAGPCVWIREMEGQLSCPAGHFLMISVTGDAVCMPSGGVVDPETPGVTYTPADMGGEPGVVEPEVTCPLGYSWRTNVASKKFRDGEIGSCVCYLEEFIEYESYVCPPNTIPKGTGAQMTCQSVTTTVTESQCPKGYTPQEKPSGLQCTRWESAKPIASCTEGMLIDAIGPPPNPAGLGGPWFVDEELEKQTKHKMCRVSSTVPPVLRCPRRAGYCPDGKNCCRLETCPPTLTCTEGTLQQTDPPTCLVSICQDPDLICPEGSAVSGGVCVSSVNGPYSTECPAGFEQTATACERLLTAPIQPLCPDGYLYMTDTKRCACPMNVNTGVQIPVVEAPEEVGEMKIPQPNLYKVKPAADEVTVIKATPNTNAKGEQTHDQSHEKSGGEKKTKKEKSRWRNKD
eukprot:GDKI01008850.1.p1 GENE.GDKI01008850.1~~GDKI01008850.1.p1  ORF type:complete len:636 (-),score=196.18 GDKI01008850.1:25-1932(-)